MQRLQLLLNGHIKPSPNLRADGGFGTRTATALMAFQKSKGLTPDGVCGSRTWTALGQKSVVLPDPPVAAGGAPWMTIAEAEVGIHENSLPGQQNKRILEYHACTSLHAGTDEVPWCSSFVNWVMKQAGYQGTNSALASSWITWGHEAAPPRAGAIMVIKRKGATSDQATGSSTGNHVGFFVSSSGAHLRLLGGNQGDSVKYSNFSLAAYEIRASRWP